MAAPPFLPDESKPGDSDIVSQYPAVERLFRDVIESWLLIDHDTAGEHKQVTLPELGADPSAATNTGFLYTKDDSGDTELFYRDDSGNIVQFTADGGAGPGLASFPATTSMLFYQSAAPTGWTKDVASLLNNHGIRVVTSTAWSTGSNGADAFTTVFGSGKNTGSKDPASVTGAHQLTVAQMPAHTHVVEIFTAGSGVTTIESGIDNATSPQNLNPTKSTGGDGTHTHTLSINHNHSLTMDLNYLNVIRATKD